MFFAFASSDPTPASVATSAAQQATSSILNVGPVGAVLILSLIANVALVVLFLRQQNGRVKDVKETGALAQNMVTTFNKAEVTLDGLTESNKTLVAAVQNVTTLLNTLVLAQLSHQPPRPPQGPAAGGA